MAYTGIASASRTSSAPSPRRASSGLGLFKQKEPEIYIKPHWIFNKRSSGMKAFTRNVTF